MNRAVGVKDCPTDHVWFRPFAWLHTDAASASHIIQGDRFIMAPEEIWEMEPGKTPVEGPTLGKRGEAQLRLAEVGFRSAAKPN